MQKNSCSEFPTKSLATASLVTIVVFAVFLLVRKHKH
jgi:hypothetical protein